MALPPFFGSLIVSLQRGVCIAHLIKSHHLVQVKQYKRGRARVCVSMMCVVTFSFLQYPLPVWGISAIPCMLSLRTLLLYVFTKVSFRHYINQHYVPMLSRLVFPQVLTFVLALVFCLVGTIHPFNSIDTYEWHEISKWCIHVRLNRHQVYLKSRRATYLQWSSFRFMNTARFSLYTSCRIYPLRMNTL